jgi:nicotinate phosphoribosyltransferase
MDFDWSTPFPEGVISFLDTDLYKLTMQCAVYKYYKDVPVTYAFTNRTPEKKLSRKAFKWLELQISSKTSPVPSSTVCFLVLVGEKWAALIS